jgi:energy-converting hydrogenase Eha subunit A
VTRSHGRGVVPGATRPRPPNPHSIIHSYMLSRKETGSKSSAPMLTLIIRIIYVISKRAKLIGFMIVPLISLAFQLGCCQGGKPRRDTFTLHTVAVPSRVVSGGRVGGLFVTVDIYGFFNPRTWLVARKEGVERVGRENKLGVKHVTVNEPRQKDMVDSKDPVHYWCVNYWST